MDANEGPSEHIKGIRGKQPSHARGEEVLVGPLPGFSSPFPDTLLQSLLSFSSTGALNALCPLLPCLAGICRSER